MTDSGGERLVYSTGKGRVCPVCGWPEDDCRCSRNLTEDDPIPSKLVAKLRIERQGRGGKTVTIIDGLPKNRAFLDGLARELKQACGTGGSVGATSVELQGDRRTRVRDLLARKGFTVKG